MLFDGYPRTYPQAEQLDKIFRQLELDLDGVIALNVDCEMLLQRITARRTCLQCKAILNINLEPPHPDGSCPRCSGELIQRDDDNESVMRKRLESYRHETAPLLNYYERKGVLYEVEANGTIDEVGVRIATSLDLIEKAHDTRHKQDWDDEHESI